MASRENQGLHIALILLVMLTIGLCLLSFVFYSKAENRRAEAESAKGRMATAQSDLATAGFRAQMLTYMISGQGKSWKEIEEELANIPGASADDPTIAPIRRNFENNMKLFPAQKAGEETALNYETLPGFLLARIRDLNLQLTGLRNTEAKLTKDLAALQAQTDKKLADAESARQAAHNDLAAERDKFNKDLDDVRKQMETLATQATAKDTRIVELNTQLDSERDGFNKRISDLAKTVDDQRNQLRKFKQTTFEVPDAIVTTVNQKEGVLYLDIGSADNLKPQQTFSVYDKGMTGVMDAKAKGRVEVLQILNAHLSMCRILEDTVSNVIVPDDLVFTPAWSPGEKIHFAIAGYVDITGSGQNETDLLTRLIELNSGTVDDQVTVQTRYLVQGDNRAGSPDADAGVGDDFDAKVSAAVEIGVDRLSPQKLLALMGWRADVTTVTLGSGQTKAAGAAPEEPATSPFRKRTPPRGTDGAF